MTASVILQKGKRMLSQTRQNEIKRYIEDQVNCTVRFRPYGIHTQVLVDLPSGDELKTIIFKEDELDQFIRYRVLSYIFEEWKQILWKR